MHGRGASGGHSRRVVRRLGGLGVLGRASRSRGILGRHDLSPRAARRAALKEFNASMHPLLHDGESVSLVNNEKDKGS